MLNFKQFESKLSKKFSFNKPLFRIAKKVSNKLGYKLIRYLSHGDYGYAFEINDNKVLKLTSDKKEIEFVKKYINKKTYSTVNFYNIIKLDDADEDVYAIIMDYIETIKDEEKELFGRLYVEFMYSTEILEGNIDAYNNYVSSEVKKFFDYDMGSVGFVEDLLNLCARAKKDGIDTFDQHPDNIGRKGNKLYFFDVN